MVLVCNQKVRTGNHEKIMIAYSTPVLRGCHRYIAVVDWFGLGCLFLSELILVCICLNTHAFNTISATICYIQRNIVLNHGGDM